MGEEDVVDVSVLLAAGAAKAKIDFDGAGDSGSIDDVYLVDAADKVVEMPAGAHSSLADWAYRELERRHPGWEINEGSYGTFELDLATGEAQLDYYGRYVETSHSTQKLRFAEPTELARVTPPGRDEDTRELALTELEAAMVFLAEGSPDDARASMERARNYLLREREL